MPPMPAMPTKVLMGTALRREKAAERREKTISFVLSSLLYGQHVGVIACNFDLRYITYAYASVLILKLKYVQFLSIVCHVEIASFRGRDGS